MKKLVVFLGIIAAIVISLMVTTPDRQQHVDTIKSVMKSAVSAELRDNNIDGPLGSIASMAATTAVDQFLNASLMVRDHRFYSLGFIDYGGEFHLVSIGVLNHVYTLDEDQARQLIKNKLQEITPIDFLKKN